LPTALANTLCNAASFATVEQVFRWMKSQNDLNLSDYMVIQAVGDEPMEFACAMAHGIELGFVGNAEYAVQKEAEPKASGPDFDRSDAGEGPR
jgi:hypothetical protein